VKIAVGAMLFEGNSFSLSRTTLRDFKDTYYFEGEELVQALGEGAVEVSGALSVLRAYGAEVAPLIATHGGCGGMVTRECFETLKRRLLDRLEAAGPVDGVFLALHGAMICEGIDNAEVELLRAVRSLVGAVPLVITCDLHAHIIPEMLTLCDGIVGYQHYPHDDAFETGVRGAGIVIQAASGAVRPLVHMKKMALLISPTMAGTRLATPMRDIYKVCRALEELPGVLALSYFPSTPWAEHIDGGTALVLTCDESFDKHDELLTELCERLWRERQRFLPSLLSIEEALEQGGRIAAQPVILSEMSDAVGAGAGGDSAYFLGAYLTTGLRDPLLIQIVDPQAVSLAKTVGVGGRAVFHLGNKIEPRHGGPVPLEAEVMGFHDGSFMYSGGPMSGARSSVGDVAILRGGACTVLATSRSAYEYADEQYKAAGLDVRDFKYVVVKNPMNFRQAYAWAPASFALDTPGSGRADLTRLPWSQCRRPFYPMDDSPVPIYRA